MAQPSGPLLRLRASGPVAIFTRPELKVERVSYPVPTPSAARGVIEAVLWKPQIRWRVERIRVLSPIRTVAWRRNEVNGRAARPSAALIESGGVAPILLADADRAQRNAVALRDVDYIFEARFELTDKADASRDNPAKYADMFTRRVERGQHFHQPYLGCRECVCDISPATGDEQPIDDSRDLGLMLWDIDFGLRRDGRPSGDNTPIFFHARMERGVIEIPPTREAALASVDAYAQSMQSPQGRNGASE